MTAHHLAYALAGFAYAGLAASLFPLVKQFEGTEVQISLSLMLGLAVVTSLTVGIINLAQLAGIAA